jgi:hypothetical protein
VDHLVLTDDEAVAAALLAGGVWPSPLPSLDMSASGLAAAATRGARSLAVRQLLRPAPSQGESPLTNDSELMIRPIISSPPAVSCSVVDEGRNQVTDALMMYQYAANDSWRFEVVSPAGVHFISTTTSAVCAAVVASIARDTFVSGILPPANVVASADAELCLQAPADTTGSILLVGKQSLRVYERDANGGFAEAATQPQSVDDALALLHGNAA